MAATLLILVLAGIAYGRLWKSGWILYSRHSDLIGYYLGAKTVLYNSLQEGRGIPFWREDQFSGYPAFSNPQALYTYPLHFLFYLVPPADAAGKTIWLDFVAAAWAMYLVGSVLGLGRWAKLLMAVAGLFNFKLLAVAYAGWLTPLPGITIFPLLFAATFYLLQQPNLGRMLIFSAVCALSLHTGQLQFFYYATLFLAAYVVSQAVARGRSGGWKTLRQAAAWLVPGGALAAGLSAYLLLPLWSSASLISRTDTSYEFFLSKHRLTTANLLTFLHPEALGTPLNGTYPGWELWEDVAYFGLVPLLLALAGTVLGWRKRPYTRYLAFSFYFSVILALDTFLLRFLYTFVPGFALFRCPNRLLFLSAFFGMCLAGIGLEETLLRLKKRWGRDWPGAVLAVLLLAVISGEGMFYARRYLQTAPVREVLPETAYQRLLSRDKNVFRLAPVNPETMNYGSAASMGLQLITGYDSFSLRHYGAFFEFLQSGQPADRREAGPWRDLKQISRWDMLDVLNVKYLLSSTPLEAPADRLEPVAHWENQPSFMLYEGMRREDLYLYRNKHFLPRAFWAKAVIGVPDEAQMASEMRRQRLDEAAIVRGAGRRVVTPVASADDRIGVLESSGGLLRLATESQTRRFAVISEVWHPGWRAFLDGRKIPLYLTDLALLGAWIPPGKHQLVLRFRPLHWRLSVAISALSLVVFGFLVAGTLRRPGWLQGSDRYSKPPAQRTSS